MSKMKDLQLRIYDIAKETLVPLFAKELNADCIEFCVGEESLEIQLMVEGDGGDKYFRMDLNTLPDESLTWSDMQYSEYFKDAFKVLIKVPLTFENVNHNLIRYE